MAHPSARLTVFSRQLLVKRVIVDGWPTATVAEQLGISRATAYKWVRRYRTDGLPGLEDRSSRPHRSPRLTRPEVVQAILAANTVPWAIANASYNQQKRNKGVTEIQKIPERGHALTIDSGWREVADTALEFVKRFV